jgi:hypothetical protein
MRENDNEALMKKNRIFLNGYVRGPLRMTENAGSSDSEGIG